MGFLRDRAARMAAGLTYPPCPECQAGRGQWCDLYAGGMVELVRFGDGQLLHSARLPLALAAGRVRRGPLVAQFAGGDLPACLA
jgi:hypothetical protein